MVLELIWPIQANIARPSFQQTTEVKCFLKIENIVRPMIACFLQLQLLVFVWTSCQAPATAPGADYRQHCYHQGEVAVVDQLSLTELPPTPCIIRPGLLGSSKLASLTPQRLSEINGYLRPAAKRSAGRVIYYADHNKAFFRRGLVQLEDVTYDTEMTPGEFFAALETTTTATTHPYRYYASRLSDLGDAELVQEASRFVVPGSNTSQTNVWMGGNGVTAQVHYDADHNLFHQIYGHKTFLLFAPDAAGPLRLFPFLHPYTRQSQYNLSAQSSPPSWPSAEFAGLGAVPCWTASLGPGDSLYLPPFYFHHVTALDTSISVNTWSAAPLPAARELKVSLPFGRNATESQALLEHFRCALRPCLDAATLLRSRYSPAMLRLLRSDVERRVGEPSSEAQARAGSAPEQSTEEACPSPVEAAAWKRDRADQEAQRVCLAYGRLPPGARDILAADALETLLLEQLTFPRLGAYFSRCLLAGL